MIMRSIQRGSERERERQSESARGKERGKRNNEDIFVRQGMRERFTFLSGSGGGGGEVEQKCLGRTGVPLRLGVFVF